MPQTAHYQANDHTNMRLPGFLLMPNHFHLVAWPRNDGDLSRWMQWLMHSVGNAENGPWSSAGTTPSDFETVAIHPFPVEKRKDWIEWINKPLSDKDHDSLQNSLVRDSPFGSPPWQNRISKRLGLESTLRPIGRPSSHKK